MKVTHTYAILELSSESYAEIREKLQAAGYSDQFHGSVIDMHGIGVSDASAALPRRIDQFGSGPAKQKEAS